jgi:hypothetical protein
VQTPTAGSPDVLALRLATQRLTGPPAATPLAAVRELLCVQAQDAPLARAMIAWRAGTSAAAVAAAVAAGDLVRTHVLRPTWHYLAAADLRWLLELTSDRVLGSLAGRHRQLGLVGLEEPALTVLVQRLSGRAFATRPELGEALVAAGVLRPGPLLGQQVGHLLLVGELRAVLCSAPAPGVHRYALVDEVVPPAPVRTRTEAVQELVLRFVTGHGPVALVDLQRWTPLPLAELRPALAAAGARLRRLELPGGTDGPELWHAPAAALPETRPTRALLLSTFDEAFLSYRVGGFPASPGNPEAASTSRFAEAAGGPVLHDLTDVGGWKRRRVRGRPVLEYRLDPGLDAAARAAIEAAGERLLALLDEVSIPEPVEGPPSPPNNP